MIKLLLLITLISLVVIIPNADAITLNNKQIKVGVTFDWSGSPNNLVNYWHNNVKLELQANVTNTISPFFTDYEIDPNWTIGFVYPNHWTILANPTINGTTSLTQNQLNNGLDNLLDDLKSIVKGHLDDNGISGYSWILNKSGGDEVS